MEGSPILTTIIIIIPAMYDEDGNDEQTASEYGVLNLSLKGCSHEELLSCLTIKSLGIPPKSHYYTFTVAHSLC
jgi:hypothetical protein